MNLCNREARRIAANIAGCRNSYGKSQEDQDLFFDMAKAWTNIALVEGYVAKLAAQELPKGTPLFDQFDDLVQAGKSQLGNFGRDCNEHLCYPAQLTNCTPTCLDIIRAGATDACSNDDCRRHVPQPWLRPVWPQPEGKYHFNASA